MNALERPEPYIELDAFAEAVADVRARAVAGGDPEASHADEDALLERFVRDLAYEGNARAALLVELLDAPRIRWYA